MSSARKLSIFALLMASITLTGCSDPRFKARQAQRNENIRDIFATARERDRQRPAALRERFDGIVERERDSSRRMNETLRQAGDRYRRAWEWVKNPPEDTVDALRFLVTADPDNISPTFADLVY